MFKVGDRVKDKDFMKDNPFATVLSVKGDRVLVNWDEDNKTDKRAKAHNCFWPATDFELAEEEKRIDHWLKIERALEAAIDCALDDFRPEDAIKYARMLDEIRNR